MRWNPSADWAISTATTHPALVSEADFIAVQNIEIPRATAPGHHYLLSGLLLCGLCGRRMDCTWSSHRAAYRCRHGNNSATPSSASRPCNAYIREDRILPHLPTLAIRLAWPPHEPTRIASRLRTDKITLTYDPKGKDAHHQHTHGREDPHRLS